MNKTMLVMQVCILLVMLAIMPAKAQEDLAKKSQNPVGSLISLPFENNLYIEGGTSNQIANVLLVKPVYPVNLGKFNLINRLIVPVIYLEGADSKDLRRRRRDRRVDLGIGVFPGTDSEFGLGNIQYQAFFSPAEAGKAAGKARSATPPQPRWKKLTLQQYPGCRDLLQRGRVDQIGWALR